MEGGGRRSNGPDQATCWSRWKNIHPLADQLTLQNLSYSIASAISTVCFIQKIKVPFLTIEVKQTSYLFGKWELESCSAKSRSEGFCSIYFHIRYQLQSIRSAPKSGPKSESRSLPSSASSSLSSTFSSSSIHPSRKGGAFQKRGVLSRKGGVLSRRRVLSLEQRVCFMEQGLLNAQGCDQRHYSLFSINVFKIYIIDKLTVLNTVLLRNAKIQHFVVKISIPR